MQTRTRSYAPWIWSATILIVIGIGGLGEALRTPPGALVFFGRTHQWIEASQAIYVYGFSLIAGAIMLMVAIVKMFRS